MKVFIGNILMDTNLDLINSQLDFSHGNPQYSDIQALFKQSLIEGNTEYAQSIYFHQDHFQNASNSFELDEFAIRSKEEMYLDWRKIDTLDVAASPYNYMLFAFYLYLALFKQQTITLHLTHKNSFIQQIMIKPIAFYQFDINIKKIEYSFTEIHSYMDALYQANQKLEFIQTTGQEEIESHKINWEKDRKTMLIQGDFFRICHTAELILNFIHPLNTTNELELTGVVGYKEHLTALSTNIHFWQPNSIGYFLDWNEEE